MKSKIKETIAELGFCSLMFVVGINLSNRAFQAVGALVVLVLIMRAVKNLVNREKEINFDEVDKLLKESKSKALANFPKGKEYMPTAKIVKGVFK